MNEKVNIKWFHSKSLLDKFFSVGIFLKGFDGIIELLTGFVFLFLSPDKLHDLVVFATHQELSEDSRDQKRIFVVASISC